MQYNAAQHSLFLGMSEIAESVEPSVEVDRTGQNADQIILFRSKTREHNSMRTEINTKY